MVKRLQAHNLLGLNIRGVDDQALVVGFLIFPLFLLTLQGWVGYCLFSIAFFAAISLIRHRTKAFPLLTYQQHYWLRLLLLVLAGPVLAVMLGQLFRHSLIWKNYDSPARFLLCLPILWVIIKRDINVLKLLSYSVPLSIFITLIVTQVHPDFSWGTHRIKTYFVDALSFGSLNLTLGIFCLLSINLYQQDSKFLATYKLLGFLAGLYLSLCSGSRTGWAALPIAIWLWFYFRAERPKLSVSLLAIALAILSSFAVYYFSTMVQSRINLAVTEALVYDWDGINDNKHSTGQRISFLRIGWFLFLENPLGGWGDQGFKPMLNSPELAKFATKFTREFAYKSGFHNEVITNMVRSGVWGLLSSCALFFVPAVFFARYLRAASLVTRKIALLSFCYIVCVFISGMSTEVFNLKFTASFHAMMYVCLIGSLLVSLRSDNTPN